MIDTIRRRRMVRAYRPDPIPRKSLDVVIASAHAAPSAGNTRSLELLVLTGRRVADYWDVTLPENRRSSFPWPGLLDAPVLLVPYVDPDAYLTRYAEPDKVGRGLGDSVDAWPVPYWWVDGGAAVENILLAAPSVGLGACFFGQFEHEAAIRSQFGVPATRRAVGTLSVGFADDSRDRPSESARRSRPAIGDVTHEEQW